MIYCIINIIGNIILFASVAFLIGKAAWEWDDSYSFIEGRKKAKKEIDKWTKPVVKILLLIWAKRLRVIYVIFASVILYYLFELFLKLRFQLFVDITNLEDNDVRNLALAFLGTISGLGALFGVYLAILKSETNERQTVTAEQGLITDRINKATEGLGKNNEKGNPLIEVRLGALYALERIAQDSIRDHVQIMEILCAYIRTNSLKKKKPAKTIKLREDIQAALTIIGRRDVWSDGEKRLNDEILKEFNINLTNCDLSGAYIPNANLKNAWLSQANMINANLTNADLGNARLYSADLSWALLTNVNLDDALLDNAETKVVFIEEGDFSNCTTLTQEQLDVMYCGIRVKIPSHLNRPEDWPVDDLPYNDLVDDYREWFTDKFDLETLHK